LPCSERSSLCIDQDDSNWALFTPVASNLDGPLSCNALVPPQDEVVGPLQILLPCSAVHPTLLSGCGTSTATLLSWRVFQHFAVHEIRNSPTISCCCGTSCLIPYKKSEQFAYSVVIQIQAYNKSIGFWKGETNG
jgi:hypothetical protein